MTKLDVHCYCCDENFEVDVLEGHDPKLEKYEECPECTTDYNECEACGKGLDSFYENEINWGKKGEKPIWTTNFTYKYDTHTGMSYGDWISHVLCPRCGYENKWDDANG